MNARQSALVGSVRQRTVEFHTAVGERTDPAAADLGDALVTSQHLAILAREADTYFVTSHMLDVLEMATLDVPPYPLSRVDLLSEDGFVIFERPVVPPAMVTDDGEVMPIVGIAWHADSEALDESGASLYQGASVVLLLGDWNDPHWRHDVMPDGAFKVWQWGTTHNDWWAGEDSERGHWDVAMIAAFWRLIQMPFVERPSESLERGTRRRLARAGLPLTETVVITIRKAKRRDDVEADGDHIDWSHRWLVRGHWRDQWYPSEQRHAPVFIAPYIKGPEDKPFVPKHRIFDVRR